MGKSMGLKPQRGRASNGRTDHQVPVSGELTNRGTLAPSGPYDHYQMRKIYVRKAAGACVIVDCQIADC